MQFSPTSLGAIDLGGVNLAGVRFENSDLSTAQFDEWIQVLRHQSSGQIEGVDLSGTNLDSLPHCLS